MRFILSIKAGECAKNRHAQEPECKGDAYMGWRRVFHGSRGVDGGTEEGAMGKQMASSTV